LDSNLVEVFAPLGCPVNDQANSGWFVSGTPNWSTAVAAKFAWFNGRTEVVPERKLLAPEATRIAVSCWETLNGKSILPAGDAQRTA
jgi:hypothetical protein